MKNLLFGLILVLSTSYARRSQHLTIDVKFRSEKIQSVYRSFGIQFEEDNFAMNSWGILLTPDDYGQNDINIVTNWFKHAFEDEKGFIRIREEEEKRLIEKGVSPIIADKMARKKALDYYENADTLIMTLRKNKKSLFLEIEYPTDQTKVGVSIYKTACRVDVSIRRKDDQDFICMVPHNKGMYEIRISLFKRPDIIDTERKEALTETRKLEKPKHGVEGYTFGNGNHVIVD